MKQLSIMAIALSLLIIMIAGTASGQNGDDIAIEINPPYRDVVGDPTEEIWIIAPFTRDCVGVGPMTCLQVKQNPDDEWQHYYGDIANFAYVEGYTYQIRVMVAELTNVPADASTQFVQVVEIVSKKSVSGIVNTEWQLNELNGDPISPDAGITITVMEDGQLAGSGGCNNYFASYTLDSDKLSIGVIGSTQMACIDGMELESTYFQILEQVTAYTIEESQLLLINDAGEIILRYTSS